MSDVRMVETDHIEHASSVVRLRRTPSAACGLRHQSLPSATTTMFTASAFALAALLRAAQDTPAQEPVAPQLDERPARSITAVPS